MNEVCSAHFAELNVFWSTLDEYWYTIGLSGVVIWVLEFDHGLLSRVFYHDQAYEFAKEFGYVVTLYFLSPNAKEDLFVWENFIAFVICFLKLKDHGFDPEFCLSYESTFLTSQRPVPGGFQSS